MVEKQQTWGKIGHTCDREETRKSGKACKCAKDRAVQKRRERGRTYGTYRAENLKRFGLTVQDYEEMRDAQGHRCKICGVHEDEIQDKPGGRPRKDGSPAACGRLLAVDHCHFSGRVRGLLCRSCNYLVAKVEGTDPRKPRKGLELLHAVEAYLSSEPTVES